MSGGGLVATEPGFTPYGVPYLDLLKLIAPRPFLEITGVYDYANCKDDESLSIQKRMAKNRSAHCSARIVYEAQDTSEALACFEHDDGHCFPEQGRKRAYVWFKYWLVDAYEPNSDLNDLK